MRKAVAEALARRATEVEARARQAQRADAAVAKAVEVRRAVGGRRMLEAVEVYPHAGEEARRAVREAVAEALARRATEVEVRARQALRAAAAVAKAEEVRGAVEVYPHITRPGQRRCRGRLQACLLPRLLLLPI